MYDQPGSPKDVDSNNVKNSHSFDPSHRARVVSSSATVVVSTQKDDGGENENNPDLCVESIEGDNVYVGSGMEGKKAVDGYNAVMEEFEGEKETGNHDVGDGNGDDVNDGVVNDTIELAIQIAEQHSKRDGDVNAYDNNVENENVHIELELEKAYGNVNNDDKNKEFANVLKSEILASEDVVMDDIINHMKTNDGSHKNDNH